MSFVQELRQEPAGRWRRCPRREGGFVRPRPAVATLIADQIGRVNEDTLDVDIGGWVLRCVSVCRMVDSLQRLLEKRPLNCSHDNIHVGNLQSRHFIRWSTGTRSEGHITVPRCHSYMTPPVHWRIDWISRSPQQHCSPQRCAIPTSQ